MHENLLSLAPISAFDSLHFEAVEFLHFISLFFRSQQLLGVKENLSTKLVAAAVNGSAAIVGKDVSL